MYRSQMSNFKNGILEQIWIFEDEDTGDSTEMAIEIGDRMRFRVKEEIFEETKPKMGKDEDNIYKPIPYKIIAAIDEDGLGPVSWW